MKHIMKQVLAFILIAAMTTVLFTVGAAAAEDTPADEQSKGALLGDVDGDGEVMIVDAAFIQRWLSGMPIPFVLNDKIADTDEDNDITIFDVNYIQRWLVNLPSNPKIGTQLEEAEEYNTIIDPECYNTVLKISDKVDSKLCSTAYQGVDDVLLGINPDAAYYFKLADTSVVDLAANRTRIYAVSEGNTTAEVFQELDDKTTKLGTINVSVVKAKMSEVADNAFLFYSGGELNGQVLKTNFGKPEFDLKTAIKKVLVNNEELGTKFSENDYEVTYQSSDEKVAVVSNSGIVSGTGNGSCQINYSIRFSDDSV